jgi:hypothetical protein
MDKIKAKVEGILHKNDHTDTTTTGTHGTHNTTTGTTGGLTGSGTHSGIHGDERHGNPSHVGSTGHTGGLTGSTAHGNTHTGSNTYGSDPTGPHDSKLANKLDPRVDSDQVGGYGNTTGAGGYGTTGHSTGHSGGLTGNTSHGNTYGSDPTGPHDSRLGNKADPRVDSDHVGGYGNTGHGGGLTGNTHTGHSGTHTGTHTGGGLTGGNTYGSDPTGPHDSHLANKADPRVDSDRVGGYGNTTGQSSGLTGNTHSGHTGTHTGTHTGGGLTGGNTYGSDPTGPHDSRLGNKADPRVDSDRVGGYGNTGGYGSTTQTEAFGNNTGGGLSGTTAHGNHGQHGLTGQGSHLPGPAQNTAGPHKSDLLNKADPRVDADLDGSKTYGGNKTYGN